MGMGDAPWKGGARDGSAADGRNRRALGRAVLLAVLAVSVVAGSAVATTGPRHTGSLLATTHTLGNGLPPPATDNPSWSGEVAWASKNGVSGFDQVTGAWVQPVVASSSSVEYADTWVGVDGYDGKLLQTGTTASTRDGTVSYEAWFVAWNGTPSGMTIIDEPVAAGDHLQVSINRNASGAWSVNLGDVTEDWTWSTTVTYAATGATAEWIEEAPGTWSTPAHYQTLADYGSATFTTVRADGAAPATVTTFDIAEDGAVVSYPSTYDASENSFTVQYGEPEPAVRSLSPTSGPASGGSVVQLSGADLGSSPVVRFGGEEAAVVHSSTGSIVVRAPAHLPGKVPVTVTLDPSGSAVAATATTDFEYQSVYGYAIATASGAVRGFGSSKFSAGSRARGATVVGLARDTKTGGYWEVASGGGVYDVDAPDLGTLTAMVDRQRIGSVSGIASTPTGSGYWLVTSEGSVHAFGSARSFGTLRAAHLGSPIVAMTAAPTGSGYWLVAADGAVYPFGKAGHLGSAAHLHFRAAPFVGMSATPTGQGYWLVASDGRVFAFGKAKAFGPAAAKSGQLHIVGIAASATGQGYWLVTSDGRVLAFGRARSCGSAPESAKAPQAVGIAAG
ncbi:MAG: G1 family glutamic endopeptidase [Acidimicrobiales bacterium]